MSIKLQLYKRSKFKGLLYNTVPIVNDKVLHIIIVTIIRHFILKILVGVDLMLCLLKKKKKNQQRDTGKLLGDVYVYCLDSSDGNTSICMYLNSQDWIH